MKDRAYQRLVLYASRLCMKCCTPLISGEDIEISKSNDEYHRVKIKFDETSRDQKDIAKCDHLICKKCTDALQKEIGKDKEINKQTGANIEIETKSRIIFCKICEDDHSVDIKEWNNLFKKTCCSSCNIY
jgi:hypothetical protein